MMQAICACCGQEIVEDLSPEESARIAGHKRHEQNVRMEAMEDEWEHEREDRLDYEEYMGAHAMHMNVVFKQMETDQANQKEMNEHESMTASEAEDYYNTHHLKHVDDTPSWKLLSDFIGVLLIKKDK